METLYFCDFDGTIAKKDIGNELHKRFSTPQWLTPNRVYKQGKISSRDCLWSQYEFFRAQQKEIENFILEQEIDPTFSEFVSWTQQKNRRILILSDGLGFYIELLLTKYGIPIPTYYSNQAVFEGNRVRIHYPYFHPDCSFACECGNCKPSHMKPYRGWRRVMIGDGISDRFAAQVAEVIYAKNRLADFCGQQQLPFFLFNDFCDIIRQEEKVSRSEGTTELKKAQNDH